MLANFASLLVISETQKPRVLLNFLSRVSPLNLTLNGHPARATVHRTNLFVAN